MVFSTNQNRHFFVVKTFNTEAATGDTWLQKTLGTLEAGEIGDIDKKLYFRYMGPAGPIKTDYIPLKSIEYVRVTKSTALREVLKKFKVTLDSDYLDSGKPIAGQDYVLRIAFRQFYGMSDEDQYFKDAVVHVTPGMTTAQFYKKMVESLNLNFSRELGATKTANPYLEFSAGTAGSEDGIYITEKEQEWILGVAAQQRVMFEVFPTTIFKDGDDFIWGEVEDITPPKTIEDTDENSETNGEQIPNPEWESGSIPDGKKIADLEYFCMGERGDQYRMVGWPNIVPTTYLVDPSKEYNVLDIHFSFRDTGVNSYKSEKDIIFVGVVPTGGASDVIEQLATYLGNKLECDIEVIE